MLILKVQMECHNSSSTNLKINKKISKKNFLGVQIKYEWVIRMPVPHGLHHEMYIKGDPNLTFASWKRSHRADLRASFAILICPKVFNSSEEPPFQTNPKPKPVLKRED